MSEKVSLLTAPNESVEAWNGVRYAYRRFGNAESAALPLLMLQHYRGNLDTWDPIFVDTLAAEREVIVVDNKGVAGSTGEVPTTIREMAHDVAIFTNALGLKRYDLLGFSMGGFVAQVLAVIRPHQVRRLILAGTGPEGGKNMPGPGVWEGDILAAVTVDQPGVEELLTMFFESTETSRQAGKGWLTRIFTRKEDRDVSPTDIPTREAQYTAILDWSVPDETRLVRLAHVVQPTLVANGDNDRVVPTENSYLLAKLISNAKLTIYPDSGHGFISQYPAEFGAEVNAFLGR